MPTLQPGELVDDRYRVHALIARGGMAAIYRGIDERLDRPIAIKVMDDRFAQDPTFRARFEREARAAAKLNHPTLVNVYDQGDDGRCVFLTMELVDGGTLRELLRERGPMPPHAALAVMQPVLTALAIAHTAGLVHRDVKPENILISDSHRVKLADFGLVRALADTRLTSSSVMMGTAAYLSPEQVRGTAIDARTDVYSAGIVLFELLTGTTPFKADTPLGTATLRLDNPVPAASSLISGIPPELDEVIARATALNPEDRYASAAEFYRAVTSLADQLGIPSQTFRVPVPVHSASHKSAALAKDYAATTVLPNEHNAPTVVAPSGTRPEPAAAETRLDARPVAPAGPPQPAVRPQPPVAPPRAQHSPIDEKPRVSNRSKVGCTLLVLLAVFAVGAVAIAGWWLGSGQYGQIPSVTGKDASVARQEIANAGFQIYDKKEYSNTVPADAVIEVWPSEGTKSKLDNPVTLTVSQGRPTVPNLSSTDSVSDYTAALASATLTVAHQVEEYSDNVAAGLVMAVDPPAGTAVNIGEGVTLTVSKGPHPVDVPDVAGMSESKARKTLEDAGLVVSGTTVDETSNRKGVIGTTPAAGTSVSKGSTVTITLGGSLTVPSVMGKTVAEARAVLEGMGLTVDTNGAGEGAHVLLQNPLPQASISRGGIVKLYAL